jgi:hypothetical protein
MTTNVNEILEGRAIRYGSFQGHAEISQALKLTMQDQTKWPMLDDDQREALEMIQHKIARILNGDPTYADNWIDIAGYATLVPNRLEKGENAA